MRLLTRTGLSQLGPNMDLYRKVIDATIGTTGTVGGDFVMSVDDGSGALQVVVDKDITFNLTPLVGGVVIHVTGVLVPTGGGVWQFKPRSAGDAIVK